MFARLLLLLAGPMWRLCTALKVLVGAVSSAQPNVVVCQPMSLESLYYLHTVY